MEPSIQNTFPRQSGSVSSYESPSASSITSAHSLIPPPSNFYSTGPPPRSLPDPTHQVSNSRRSPVGFAGPDYSYRPYSVASGSPSSVTGSSIQETLPPNDPYGSAGISPTHVTGASLSAQKRAYRQRRKDPSCDACRERKVKCDATETSSCSECSSRSVKCQFTKETNRRMSSIKQVQDLQNQLTDARQEIVRLKSSLQGPRSHPDRQGSMQLANLPALGPRTHQPQGPPVISNFDQVRKGIKAHSRGLFKIPAPARDLMPTPKMTTTELTLPARHITNTLLAQYLSHSHRHAPMIHWPTFTQQIDQVYLSGGFHGCTQIWVGVFFGVLACATCQTIDTAREGVNPDVDGMKYLIIAARLLNTWTDNLTIDHARTCYFIATFLTEQNIRSAGWCWLGSAVRMVQDIGLQSEGGPWAPLDAEARRRVCWSIYALDRLHSLEGRPLSVYEEDFVGSIGLPNHSSDEWLQPQPQHFPTASNDSHPSNAGPTIIIPVIQMVAEMKKTLKSRVVAPENLKRYDDYFHAIMRVYPEPYQVQADTYLDALSLTVILPLQVARFMLYRHNLSIWSQAHERTDAINRMAAVAVDTVRYLKRSMRSPPSSPTQSSHSRHSPSWQELLKSQSSNLLCRHIWRCTLVLSFRGDFENAEVCIRASTVIGPMRKHNIACGRNLAYFLDALLGRAQRGQISQYYLEQDEEMMAHLSGDMQGDQDAAWIWAGVEPQPHVDPQQKAVSPVDVASQNGTPQSDVPSTDLLTDKEVHDWGGWERVSKLLGELVEVQQREQQHRQTPLYHQPAHNIQKRLHLAPPEPVAPPPRPSSTSGTPTPSGASRISIANII